MDGRNDRGKAGPHRARHRGFTICRACSPLPASEPQECSAFQVVAEQQLRPALALSLHPSTPLSRALPPPSRTPLSVGVRRNTRWLICLVAPSKPAVAADPLGSAGGRARNALAIPRDCAGGARRVDEHGRAKSIGREVPAADVLVEGGQVAPLNIPAHAHTRRKHGEAEAGGGCEEGCRGAGRDARLVFSTLAMFQLLMSWLKEVAPWNISAHAHTRRKHGEAGSGGGCG